VSSERMPRRRLRNTAIGLGLTVFLALSATGVHAAWTASTSKSATATNGTIGLTTTGVVSLSASYTTENESTIAKIITVANNGTTPLTVTSFEVTNADALSGVIRLALWERPTTGCQPAPPATAYLTLLSNGVKTLSQTHTMAAGSSVQLCTLTTFTGTLATFAGYSTSPTLTFIGTVGTSWSTADASAPTNRLFTQSVAGVRNPQNVTCTNVTVDGKGAVDLSWSAVPAAISYTVKDDKGKTLVSNVTSVPVRINQVLAGNPTSLTVHALVGPELSGGIVVLVHRDGSSIFCGPAA
jgi:hypothetical protein